jgi:decaprenyl-phosphate phosphoribosyltransferase
MRIISLIKLIRPQQWVKNTFLFVPIFFSGDFFDTDRMLMLFLGFVAFSIVSSAVYVLNDFKDIEADKLHPVKQFRPLASGAISKTVALVLMFLLGATGLGLSYFIKDSFCLLLIGYVVMNIFYSLGLKNVSIVDILIVATGFVLRTIAGGIIADVPISHWLVIMIFLLSLFLVLAKRREDMLEYVASGKAIRKSIANYNMDFINLTITMLSGVIIVSYIMYTVSPEVVERMHSTNLYMTSVFVITGLLRYLQITLVENRSGSPVRILYTDKFIHITLVGWILTFFLIIYYR